MKGPSSDEQDVVGLDLTMSRGDLRTLDDGKNVALHPFPAHIGPPARRIGGRDLVDLVNEDDAVFLDPPQRFAGQTLLVDQTRGFFADEHLAGLGNRQLAPRCLLWDEAGEHVLQVDAHLVHARRTTQHLESRHISRTAADIEFNDPIIEMTRAQHLLEFLAGAIRAVGALGVSRIGLGPVRVVEGVQDLALCMLAGLLFD